MNLIKQNQILIIKTPQKILRSLFLVPEQFKSPAQVQLPSLNREG